ncbi:ornithine cyclodeaminase family protein [Piscinibacter sakaiensis]|uniref:ornithine cyclodeaminase family protein n=1 Tax=Piscinibacter sakaiensis TaxID=1547922 RepID=UPI003AAE9998
MQLFDAAATRDALPLDRLIAALREAFAADDITVPLRHVHEVAGAAAQPPAFTSLIMPAWQAGRAYGVKIVNIAPGNAARGLPGLHASYLLHDAATGVPIALLDGDQITARRTAAASALAASFLARDDASRLLVVGAGRVAGLLPAAYRCVRGIERVTVWARSAKAATALVDDLRADGFDAHAATDLPQAAGAADVVSCATLASAPVICGRWLRDGSHLDLIGSFTPAMREADDDCFRGSRLFVDTDEALVKSGELLGPIARGVISAADVQATLADLCRGTQRGRQSTTERTVFKSVGSALEDLVAAMLVAGA